VAAAGAALTKIQARHHSAATISVGVLEVVVEEDGKDSEEIGPLRGFMSIVQIRNQRLIALKKRDQNHQIQTKLNHNI
jgi:hypothetical protein